MRNKLKRKETWSMVKRTGDEKFPAGGPTSDKTWRIVYEDHVVEGWPNASAFWIHAHIKSSAKALYKLSWIYFDLLWAFFSFRSKWFKRRVRERPKQKKKKKKQKERKAPSEFHRWVSSLCFFSHFFLTFTSFMTCVRACVRACLRKLLLFHS